MWEPAISGMGNAHNCAPKLQVYLPIFSLTPKASGSTRLQSCEVHRKNDKIVSSVKVLNSYKYEEVFMEKNENEELLEQSPAEIQQEDTPEIAKSGEEEPDTEEQKVSNGRFILWSLAGVYLLYTSYSLCKGYVTGEEGTSMGFMLAGIAFAAIGAGLLFFGIKNMLSEEKIRKAKAAKNAAMEAAAGGELKKEDASGQNRSMSIAERANMVKNLEDEEEDGENEKE